MAKQIKFDCKNFGDISGFGLEEKVQSAHKLMLDGIDSNLKDGNVVMTGWKMESPYVPTKDLDLIKKTASDLRNKIDDFVSVGIGGSYLGIKATIDAVVGNLELFNLLPPEKRNGIPRIFFLGNHMDPAYTQTVINIISGQRVGVCVISKSGGTVEPAIAFAILKDMMDKKFKNASELIVAITDAKKGALKELACKEGYKTFKVPDNVGGRFSVTCPVGLFDLALAGVDIHEFIAGAKFAEEQTRSLPFNENIPMLRAAMRFIAHKKLNKKIELVSTGIYNLKGVTGWMQQLGPESEGKNGEGLFIVPQFYTQEAHADGQMIQMGERNLIETFLMLEKQDVDIKISSKGTPVDYVDGKQLSFVNQAFIEGLRDAHFEGGVPTMSYILPDLSAYTLGQFYQLEMNTIALSSLLLGQNPFIQPGVQLYKKIADAKVRSYPL